MKKLLVLTLILAMASAANAVLVLSFNGDTEVEVAQVAPSDDFTIDVYQDTATYDEFWVDIQGDASWSGNGTLYIPPAPSQLVLSLDYGWIHVSGNPTVDGDVGTWWDLTMHCDGPGDVTVDLYDSSGYILIDSLTIQQIPEPITVALLGLGGLLLRRRK